MKSSRLLKLENGSGGPWKLSWKTQEFNKVEGETKQRDFNYSVSKRCFLHISVPFNKGTLSVKDMLACRMEKKYSLCLKPKLFRLSRIRTCPIRFRDQEIVNINENIKCKYVNIRESGRTSLYLIQSLDNWELATGFVYTYIEVVVALESSSVTVSYSSFANEEVCCYKFQQVWISCLLAKFLLPISCEVIKI